MENRREELGKCPECGNPVYEGKKSFYCSGYKEGCKFVLWKNSLDRLGHADITPTQARQLLNNETIAFTGLKSRAGNEFDAEGKLAKTRPTGGRSASSSATPARKNNSPPARKKTNKQKKSINGIFNKPINKKNGKREPTLGDSDHGASAREERSP
jgi:DNA topoisomerase-3